MNSAKKSNKRFKYSFFATFSFYFFAITAVGKLSINFLRHISFPSSNCKLGAGLFISITLRANLTALHAFKYKITIFLNRALLKAQGQLQHSKFFISFHMPFKSQEIQCFELNIIQLDKEALHTNIIKFCHI